MNVRIARMIGALLFVSVLWPLAVVAQDADEDEMTFEVVLVTATRREESLQDISIAVTALSGDFLQDIGAINFSDYARFVPGLDFSDQGTGQNRITIRGISPESGVQTVGMYFDEIPTNAANGGQFDIKLVDIERVEVLKGPQGTRYGEGSMGGTIRVLTAKPNAQEMEGRVAGSYSSVSHGGSGYNMTGMINIPIVEDTFALRVVAYHEDSPGFIDNVFLEQEDVNDEVSTGGRVAATWFATDQLSITGTFMFQDVKTGGRNYASSDQAGELEQAAYVEEPYSDNFSIGNLLINYEMGWADFMSSTSVYDRETTNEAAFFSPGSLAVLDFFAGLFGLEQPIIPFIFREDYDAVVQEFRFVSNKDGPLQWVAGVFYKDHNDDITSDLRVFDILLPILGAPPLGIATAFQNFQQYAVYVDLAWQATERFELGFGGRYFKEDQENINGVVDPTTGVITVTQTRDESFSQFVPRIDMNFAINDAANFYALIADGFRSGGVNGNPGGNIPATFDSDKVRSYEVGLKTVFADGRVALNAALYYNDWTNMQTSDFDPSTALSFTSNLGDAHTSGIEADISAMLIDGLTVRLAGNYTEAELDSDVPASGAVEGDKLQSVPELSWSASIDYRWPLFDQYSGMVRADYQYVGSSYSNFANSSPNTTKIPSYNLLNLRAGIETEKWYVHLFVRNATDEVATLVFGPDFFGPGFGVPESAQLYRNRPRTVGIEAALRF